MKLAVPPPAREGDFVIANVAPGVYGVTLRKPGLSIGSIEDVEVKAGKTRALGDHRFCQLTKARLLFIRGQRLRRIRTAASPGVRVELARIIDESSIQKLDSRHHR